MVTRRGSRPPFSLEFCIIFFKIILRKINITYIHVTGNCSDPPSLFGCITLHLVSVFVRLHIRSCGFTSKGTEGKKAF